MSQSPIDQTARPRTRRSSVLATSIIERNPHLSDKHDRELVAAHFRTLYQTRLKVINDWAACQTANKTRDGEYQNRVESLQSKIRRESGIELMRVGLPLEQSNDVAAALIGADDEYRAAMTTLNDKLFA